MGIYSPIVTGPRNVVDKLNKIPFHRNDFDQPVHVFVVLDFSSLYTSTKMDSF